VHHDAAPIERSGDFVDFERDVVLVRDPLDLPARRRPTVDPSIDEHVMQRLDVDAIVRREGETPDRMSRENRLARGAIQLVNLGLIGVGHTQ